MSGPLKLTAQDATTLGEFLESISDATVDTGWRLAPYGRTEIQAPDDKGVLNIRWHEELTSYVIDDVVGE